MSENITTITEARQVIEDERQRRGAAFQQALQSIQAQYNCTMTVEPAWRPTSEGTFTLAVRVAVLVGDPPTQAAAPEMSASASEPKLNEKGEGDE